jgi:hypothetical protein
MRSPRAANGASADTQWAEAYRPQVAATQPHTDELEMRPDLGRVPRRPDAPPCVPQVHQRAWSLCILERFGKHPTVGWCALTLSSLTTILQALQESISDLPAAVMPAHQPLEAE